MSFDVRPAAVFDDVRQIIGPRHPGANVCWCLSYRIPSAENNALTGPDRGRLVEKLCDRAVAPGVLAYEGDTPVGWAGVAPRRELNSFARSRKIPHVDDLDVWTIWCFRTRAGNRGRGIARALLSGAIDFARRNGAPAVEGYPVDNKGERVDLTMAYVGTRKLFESAGFEKAADTTSVLDGFPRVLMRLELRDPTGGS
ncbi:GNAT family N-acetyltransferase [Amnibacterium flavum]|uniref:GNAT family N-acetyltransferase n=1 Tax=Amnibacterium flavum TaxID=2173173 RepID=A0A2V1HSM5_9MICO|nr:GNAT family N-acetyltransferase [Amnibacterium flavum]PVZ94672.1 GNAT family N-acetyltransferase [Amnibacterium flavum]